MLREKSAGAIIFRRENRRIKYLLLHYEAGHWDFPRGNIEKGETELATAQREIKEETRLTDFRFIPDFRITTHWFYKKKIDDTFETVSKYAFLYLAETKEEKATLSFEHIGYAWLEYTAARRQLTYDNSKRLLDKAHNYLITHS